MKRNIWIPKMTTSKLVRLLKKQSLTDDEKEDLLDFKYFMLHQQQSAAEKGLMVELVVCQKEKAFVPKNKFWLTNIEDKVKGFQSQYNL